MKFKDTLNYLLVNYFIQIKVPVFILSAPRSGSTYLYEILRRCRSVISLNHENDNFWWTMFPYSRLEFPNDYISENEIHQENIEYIQKMFSLHICKNIFKDNPYRYIKLCISCKKLRYLEKTVANCFHLCVLSKIFPDAKYIYLVRDGRATVSSMVEGWKSNRFMKRTLPLPLSSNIDYWTFPIPPDWINVVNFKINEICAWSWVQHNEYVINHFKNNPSQKDNLIQITYEELTENPNRTIDLLIEFCGFNKSPQLKSYLNSNILSRTTISEPDPNKWKKNNYLEICEIEHIIYPMMSLLGYRVNQE